MIRSRLFKPNARVTKITASRIDSKQPDQVTNVIVESLLKMNHGRGSSRKAIKNYIRIRYPGIPVSIIKSRIQTGIKNCIFMEPHGSMGMIYLVTDPFEVRNSKSFRVSMERQGTKRTQFGNTNKMLHISRRINLREMIIQGITTINDGKGTSRNRLKEYVMEEFFFGMDEALDELDELLDDEINNCIDKGDLVEPDGPNGLIRISTLKKVVLMKEKQRIESK